MEGSFDFGMLMALAFIIPGLLIVWVIWKIKRSAQKFNAMIKGIPTLMMTKRANFLGRKSDGKVQAKGNGFAALTEARLIVFRMAPEKVVEVPVSQITGAEVASTFMGRGIMGKNMPAQMLARVGILVVKFLNERRDPDELGIVLEQPGVWKEKIEGVMKERKEKWG